MQILYLLVSRRPPLRQMCFLMRNFAELELWGKSESVKSIEQCAAHISVLVGQQYLQLLKGSRNIRGSYVMGCTHPSSCAVNSLQLILLRMGVLSLPGRLARASVGKGGSGGGEVGFWLLRHLPASPLQMETRIAQGISSTPTAEEKRKEKKKRKGGKTHLLRLTIFAGNVFELCSNIDAVEKGYLETDHSVSPVGEHIPLVLYLYLFDSAVTACIVVSSRPLPSLQLCQPQAFGVF